MQTTRLRFEDTRCSLLALIYARSRMLSGRFAYACLVTSRQRFSVTSSLCGAALRVSRPFLGICAPVQHFLYPPVHLPLHQQQAPARNFAVAAAMDDKVRGTLHKLLPTVDMEKTTERQVGCLLTGSQSQCCAVQHPVLKLHLLRLHTAFPAFVSLASIDHTNQHDANTVAVRVCPQQIREMLAELLGADMAPYKKLIKVCRHSGSNQGLCACSAHGY
jgi:hypothetical protein